jgi:hypothetical protein
MTLFVTGVQHYPQQPRRCVTGGRDPAYPYSSSINCGDKPEKPIHNWYLATMPLERFDQAL